MWISVYFILFILFTVNSSISATDCTEKKNAQARLKDDLLCGYERTIRPVINHKDPVKVNLRLILKFFTYDEHYSSFTIDSWMAVFWKDEFLKWNPNDHESVDSINLSSDEIWLPDISVYNRDVQGGSPAAFDSGTCIVYNTGNVVCVPSTRHSSLCVGDLTKYPFDVQNCTVRFGSWVHSGEEIDIRLSKPPISTEDLVPNGDWRIVKTHVVKHSGNYSCCPNNTYPSINYSFLIERLNGAHTASVVLPAIALIVITLTSLWVQPTSNERLMLCCVNLICQYLYSEYISWMIPMRGEDTPLLILFGRDSLLLAAFTLVFTVGLKNMLTDPRPAPGWMSALVSVLTSCRCGQFILLNNASMKQLTLIKNDGEEDGTNIIDSNNTMGTNHQQIQDWFIFAKILDRLCFIAYFIIYVSMFIAFTP